MSRYAELFTRLAAKKEGAFVPFVTLGDPDRELSLQIIDALVAGGADALELASPSPIRWPMARPFRMPPAAP